MAAGPNEPMTSAEALTYLNSLFRPGTPAAPGLDRMHALLARLGHPEHGLRLVHITGTNGKGSVAAMVASVLGAAGHRTGLFISPYLERFGERIVLDGQEMPSEALAELMPLVRRAIEEMAAAGAQQPTQFEATTALACLYFARSGAEIIACEVGLGGRNDATNALPGSLVSVITSVAMDHVERIGPELVDIAYEKAGIIRPRGHVITGRLPAEAAAVVVAEADQKQASLARLGVEFDVRPQRIDHTGVMADVLLPGRELRGLGVGLLGRHQADNMAVAVAAVAQLARASKGAIVVDDEAVRRGLAATSWPGRIELFSESPPVLLDGAHNPQAIVALARALDELFGGRRIVGVIGALSDHAQASVFDAIVPRLMTAVVTTPPFGPRAMPAAELGAAVRQRFASLPVLVEPDVAAAIEAALTAQSEGRADMVLITGSFYLVGEARGILKRRLGQAGLRQV